eukprot:gene19730-24978_t
MAIAEIPVSLHLFDELKGRRPARRGRDGWQPSRANVIDQREVGRDALVNALLTMQRQRQELCYLLQALPDPDQVHDAHFAALITHLKRCVAVVGLMVDPTPDYLAQVLSTVALDVIQMHGRETPEQVAATAARHGVPVWKALGVKTRADLAAADRFAGAAARVLFDAKPPEGADLPGGNGLRIDGASPPEGADLPGGNGL